LEYVRLEHCLAQDLPNRVMPAHAGIHDFLSRKQQTRARWPSPT
jgi:hypothetical protein